MRPRSGLPFYFLFLPKVVKVSTSSSSIAFIHLFSIMMRLLISMTSVLFVVMSRPLHEKIKGASFFEWESCLMELYRGTKKIEKLIIVLIKQYLCMDTKCFHITTSEDDIIMCSCDSWIGKWVDAIQIDGIMRRTPCLYEWRQRLYWLKARW